MVNKGKDSAPRCAIYPGTFDPIHNGHIDIIRRSVAIFDEVIVAVAYNPHKDPALFSPDERVDMIRETHPRPRARARGSTSSAASRSIMPSASAPHIIIRSLRAVTDFDYELQMAHMNKQMWSQVETVFLFANPKLFFSASRLIKEVASYGKRLPELVPEMVMNRLRAKLKID